MEFIEKYPDNRDVVNSGIMEENNMSRKHENFSYKGYKYSPEAWRFYYNGKYIYLEVQTISSLAQMIIAGKRKEAEDALKRLLRKEEKRPHDYITFGFYGKDSTEFYYTSQLKAHRTDLAEKLRIYKKWKRYIIEDCNGRLQPFTVTTGYITPDGNTKATEEDTSVLIDTYRRGVVIRFVENPENRMFRV